MVQDFNNRQSVLVSDVNASMFDMPQRQPSGPTPQRGSDLHYEYQPGLLAQNAANNDLNAMVVHLRNKATQ